MDLNPDWDRGSSTSAGPDGEDFDRYTADDMDAAAGHSSHEVRTWVAAISALHACGDYARDVRVLPAHPGVHRGLRRHHRRPPLTHTRSGRGLTSSVICLTVET